MCLWWQFEFVCQRNSLPFVCLPVAVIVELIVGRERDEASPSSRQREEDLSGCVFPHLTEGGRKSCRSRAGKDERRKNTAWLNQTSGRPVPLRHSVSPTLVWWSRGCRRRPRGGSLLWSAGWPAPRREMWLWNKPPEQREDRTMRERRWENHTHKKNMITKDAEEIRGG